MNILNPWDLNSPDALWEKGWGGVGVEGLIKYTEMQVAYWKGIVKCIKISVLISFFNLLQCRKFLFHRVGVRVGGGDLFQSTNLHILFYFSPGVKLILHSTITCYFNTPFILHWLKFSRPLQLLD